MNTEPSNPNSPQPAPKETRPLDPRKMLGIMLLLVGSGGVIAGATHLMGVFTLPADPFRLGDAIENLVFGLFNLAAWRLALKGRMLSLWLFLTSIVISLVYSFAVGRGLNVILAIIGVYIAILALQMRKQGLLV